MKTHLLSYDHKQSMLVGFGKLWLCFVFLTTFSFSLYAQVPSKQWDKTFGGTNEDALSNIAPTSDRGFLLAGTSYSGVNGDKSAIGKGGADGWVVKIDANGTKLWDKTFGGSANDGLSIIIQTSEGGFLLGGLSNSGISGDKSEISRGGYDYWVVKIDANGNKLWDKTFGTENGEGISSLIETSDGNYVLAGTSDASIGGDKSEDSRGGYDYWIIKIDNNGNKLWDKTFGGSGVDGLTSISQTADGGILVGGTSDSDKSGDKSEGVKGDYFDFWVVKIDAHGNKQWDKTLGGNHNEELYTLKSTTDGGFLIGGTSNSDISGDKSEAIRGGYSDYWVIKLDALGNKQWDKTFGGNNEDYLFNLIQTKKGNFLLGGHSGSGISGDKTEANHGIDPDLDYWIIEINSEGIKQWDKTFGGTNDDRLSSIIEASNGSFLLAGYSLSGIGGDKSEVNRGIYDYWVVKTTPEFTPLPIALQINFQDKNTKTPASWTKDYGLPFGEKSLNGKAYQYGWKKRSDGSLVDLSVGGSFPGNGRWRPAPTDVLLATLMHMQGDDVQDFRGTPVEAYWEVAVENGEYQVTVSVGDGTNYTATAPEYHSINVEGVSAIANFIPKGANGSLTRFKQATVKVTVSDGLLTLDADGGRNTKINYAIIQPLSSTASVAQSQVNQSLQVEQAQQEQLQAFPNPFSDRLAIDMKGQQGRFTVTLQDALGTVHYQGQQDLHNSMMNLDLSAIPLKAGMYFISITAQDGSKHLIKVLKK